MDIIICTYRREEYINRNLKILSNIEKEYPVLRNKIHVNIIDNGQTLTEFILPDKNKFSLYQNINTGGSGGFTRGIIEVIKKNKKQHIYYCLMMILK